MTTLWSKTAKNSFIFVEGLYQMILNHARTNYWLLLKATRELFEQDSKFSIRLLKVKGSSYFNHACADLVNYKTWYSFCRKRRRWLFIRWRARYEVSSFRFFDSFHFPASVVVFRLSWELPLLPLAIWPVKDLSAWRKFKHFSFTISPIHQRNVRI